MMNCVVLAFALMAANFASGELQTDTRDVDAINGLFVSLNFPPLSGWVALGGDPCLEHWQGVSCVIKNITSLKLSNLNLGGTLDNHLGLFASILDIDLSNNHIGGTIPSELPPTLLNLDLSGNNLSGQLPPSFGNLSSLNSLHLQNNSLTGVLDVLQDLPLQDLDVENNQFSGPIPANLLKIPNFRKDGNPFNTTVIPSSPIASPPLSAVAPESSETLENPGNSSSIEAQNPQITRAPFSLKKPVIVGILVGAIALIVLALCLWLVFFKRRHKKPDTESTKIEAYNNNAEKPTNIQAEKVSKDHVPTRREQLKPENRIPEVALKPIDNHPESSKSPNSVKVFTIATLQQYTSSFSEQNLLGKGSFGSVYKAQLPDGKLLAVKKLSNMATRQQTDNEFLELVSSISKIRHTNIIEFVGYCNEHGQRLLVHRYCEMGTLNDALHVDNDIHSKLSWDARIRIALGAARALQYLHEICQPPVIHRNFRSGNILLDDKLGACISDCGLAHLLLPGHASELAGRLLSSSGYAAPEFELGSYTCKSDIYSFGVVMLELLTGRKSYDTSRNRWEQSLVRWAIPRLHDIDSLSKMVDPSLNGAYSAKALSRFADIIARCVQSEPGFRPVMSEIVQDLLHML